MRLIDADALVKKYRDDLSKLTAPLGGYRYLTDDAKVEYDRIEAVLATIESAPTINPVKRARWIDTNQGVNL